MRSLFVDSSYFLALLNPRDALHERARLLSASLGFVRLVTSEMVLAECLNSLAGQGTLLRGAAVELVQRLREDPEVQIVPGSGFRFYLALDLYAARSDKGWSHTDCASFQIMEEGGVREALTHDRHFEQAGFRALLR